ncbi:MAG: stage IV sporulation protein A [Acetatifactor sp.]|nr:stage IV sporulation protein A [Acetatifactor sp.]
MEQNVSTYDLYHDIQERTGGEIYIGVLGPVRTGKSTFIKRFMEEMVLPNMEDDHAKTRAQDEMPQSAGGKTITTTEPKFVPNEAAKITLSGDVAVSVRLVDCVGYMVEGAAGHLEEETERMVKTPWFEEEIPFTRAAEVGTDKVMNDHSTIGIVVTCDGSFGEIPRENFLEAEERTITALKRLKKPFLVLVNSKRPYGEEAREIAAQIGVKYDVTTMAVNCEQLKKEDIHQILEKVLYEFPIASIEFYMPRWVCELPKDDILKKTLTEEVEKMMQRYTVIRDVKENPITIDSEYVRSCRNDSLKLSDGCVRVDLEPVESYYYRMLSDTVGEEIDDASVLIEKLRELSEMKTEYMKVRDAVNLTRIKGYGVVTPDKEEITLEKPELIRHGNKFGVKIKAVSPSIHMIRANIETEIAPIVGTQQQAEDLISYIDQSDDKEGMWNTNIFGKTVEQLVNDGIMAKMAVVGEESQLKLQDTMQKVVNDSNGGMVCIIL